MNIIWSFDQSKISWNHLADLYRVAPLGKPEPKDWEFSGSKKKEASESFILSMASRRAGKSVGFTGYIPLKTSGFKLR